MTLNMLGVQPYLRFHDPSPIHHAVMAMSKLEYFDEIRTTPCIILSDEIIKRNEDFLENDYLF